MSLPSGFSEMIKELLGPEADSFLSAMLLPPAVSVRLNSRKQGASFPEGRPVKWCDKGFYLPERPLFTLDPLLHAGAYYVQDASSMIYHEATKRICRLLSPLSPDTPVALLDLCAAPGGKTTAMTDALPDGSRIVANEYVGKRAAILRENIAKWGYPGTVVTNRDSALFAKEGEAFDIVAVDAPCSGEGMMRKDSDAVRQWCPELIVKCAALQREILRNAADSLKPGGFLIYSTCTFNTAENERNAEFIAETLGLCPVDLDFPDEWGIGRGIGTHLPVWRFMPHITEGEGLFLAVFRKPGEWLPPRIRPLERQSLSSPTDVPPIEEVLSVSFDRRRFPEAELSERQALAYLRREAVSLPPDSPKGLTVMTYKGLPLGMAKNIGPRANNLYPKQWRILMR